MHRRLLLRYNKTVSEARARLSERPMYLITRSVFVYAY